MNNILLIKVKGFFYNLLIFIFRIAKYGESHWFSAVEIETNSVCNRKCLYCPNSLYKREPGLMDKKLFMKIIRELKDLRYSGHIYPHFYGEPLLDRRLPELIKYTRSNLKNCWIRIYTNGDFLTKSLFEKLVANGVNEFYVTGHGGFRPKNIKKLQQTDLGSKIIHFQKVNSVTNPLFNRGGLVRVKKPIVMDKCLLSANNLVIDFKGNVILCCNDYFSKYKFGNVKKEKIVNIWRKNKYKRIRNDIKKGKFNLKICQKCIGI